MKYRFEHGLKLLLARRLNEANIQYVGVNVDSWDDHYYLWNPEISLAKPKVLDKALATFVMI